MKTKSKRALSVLLAVLMLVTAAFPLCSAFAATTTNNQLPTVYVRGSGYDIVDENDVKVYRTGYDYSQLPKTIARVVYPYLVNAVLFNKWDAYYDAFGKEVEAIFEKCALDNDGNPKYGTQIAPNRRVQLANSRSTNYVKGDGTYSLNSYTFWYDWRLDPMQIADEMDAYINDVLAVTGASRVNMVGRCLGGSYVLAYIAKYGNDKVANVTLNATAVNGYESCSDLFAGKIGLKGDAAVRYMQENYSSSENADAEDVQSYLNSFIVASAQLANESGLLKTTGKAFDKFYKKVYKGLVPKIALASVATWPGYWSSVKPEDYETARNLMFGSEENKAQYKVLIEKLDNYHEQVALHVNDILADIKADGFNVVILAKYGKQLLPVVKDSADLLSDASVSLKTASFGATCSNIDATLGDDYIAAQTEKGLGKYISADKQVDASTCLYPESTWIVKNMVHDNWASSYESMVYALTVYPGDVTINTFSQYPQFLVYNDGDGSLNAMTSENCTTEKWESGTPAKHNLLTSFKAYFAWLKTLFKYIGALIKGGK